MNRACLFLAVFLAATPSVVLAQSVAMSKPADLPSDNDNVKNPKMESTDDWNRRIQELVHSALSTTQNRPSADDYRIGPADELAVNVLEAPDLSSAFRVSADGNISMPLLGTIKVAGMTPREVELVLQALLRRTYMKDPQVTVTVVEMQSHSVSVLGAVKKPGVFQIRGTKTLLEMLSMAEGLAPDAGDAVLVMRGAGTDDAQGAALGSGAPSGASLNAPERPRIEGAVASANDQANGQTIEISLKKLLDSGDSKYNVAVFPGDIVKVKAAGIVYVVGDVKQPGGFPVKDNEHITVLQAIALGQGLASTAAKSKASIIRVAQNGQQTELPIDLGKILNGKAPDIPLRPKDILFVPKSGAKSAGRAALDTFAKWIVWRGVP